jgi:hyaluronoglucosaminidase
MRLSLAVLQIPTSNPGVLEVAINQDADQRTGTIFWSPSRRGGLMQTHKVINSGVIEGFFGRPWDWAARLSGADFLSDCGFQFYIYAPKADPYLRRRWREPLPAATMRHLSELELRCRSRGMVLGIGLTPFESYLNYDANTRMLLRLKVQQINLIGIDLLCILFDDMRGDLNGLAEHQAMVISDVCGWSNAEHFIVCPTYYSYDIRLTREFGVPAATYLRDFGRNIDPGIDIFWTGEKVISEGYSAKHLTEVATQIGRKPFIWDNHISNDSKIRTDYLFLDPSTSTWDLPADLVAGIAINPMNQPHLSRIALCEYRRLLSARPGMGGEQVLPDACRRLYESSFAERLRADGSVFQQAGLNQLDSDARRRFLDRYGIEEANPYAQEICAWLRGEYMFDPQCLTT